MPTLVQQVSVSLCQLLQLVASLILDEFSVMAMTDMHVHQYKFAILQEFSVMATANMPTYQQIK